MVVLVVSTEEHPVPPCAHTGSLPLCRTSPTTVVIVRHEVIVIIRRVVIRRNNSLITTRTDFILAGTLSFKLFILFLLDRSPAIGSYKRQEGPLTYAQLSFLFSYYCRGLFVCNERFLTIVEKRDGGK